MKNKDLLKMKKTEVYIPKSANKVKVSSLCIVAHPDDAEILAASAIDRAFEGAEGSFACVIVTDGGGSARAGEYADFSDEDMKKIRIEEQKKAAETGQFESLFLLGFSSAELKADPFGAASEKVKEIILQKAPQKLYVHSPFDSHATHVAVCKCVMHALLQIDRKKRPEKVLGGEVWRSLDWLPAGHMVVEVCSAEGSVADRALLCHKSQIDGGKRYDLAAAGRRRANATFGESRAIDEAEGLCRFVDMTSVSNGEISLDAFVRQILTQFSEDVMANFEK